MNNLVLGLDIGITSVGWGIVDKDLGTIIDAGVRLFQEASSKGNEDRRTFRSGRRLKRRKAFRILRVENLLKSEGILTSSYKPSLYNPYLCRKKGLNEKLTNDELVAAILHIAKMRGSSLETIEDESNKESGVIKETLKENNRLLSGKYICEIQLERLENDKKIRGSKNIFKTDDYVKELEKILSNQNLTKEVNDKLVNIIKTRRHFSEGPGGPNSPTPYGRYLEFNSEPIDLIKKMQGKCSIFKDKYRAPINSYTYCEYNLYNELNNLTIANRKITSEEKKNVFINYIHKFKSISLKDLAKICNVSIDDISGYRIDKNGKPLFTDFKLYKSIQQKINDLTGAADFLNNPKNVDKVADILTETKILEERIEKLSKITTQEIAISLSSISNVSKYGHLSYEALDLFINEMKDTSENQMVISKRLNLEKGYIDYLKNKNNIPYINDDLTNPVVVRASREAIKVINAIRKKYGELDSIVIEMARDKNSDEEKRNIEKLQKRNELIKKQIEGFLGDKANLTNKLRTKLRLALEQELKCAYSGEPIDIDELINDAKAYEVDHILPISLSFDDSYNNKVLVKQQENQNKGKRTPFEYFKSGDAKMSFSEFASIVKNNRNYSKAKVDNLLFEGNLLDEETQNKFVARNLQDTRFACRNILNLIKDFYKVNEINTKVFAIRGAITSQFRKKAHIEKIREIYSHHAIDALILAQIRGDHKLIGHLDKELRNENDISNYVINVDTGEVSDDFLFSQKVLEKSKYIKNYVNSSNYIKFSWKVDRRANRSVADQTIYSTRLIDGEHKVIKKYKDIYGKDGEKIKDLFLKKKEENLLVYRNDKKTFDIVKKVIESYPDEKNPFLAYKNEHGKLKKYSKKGLGPEINSLKYIENKLGNHIDISQNYNVRDKKVVLLQISPYRMDLYKDGNVFKFITIRYPHVKEKNGKFFISPSLYKKLKERKGISDTAKFVFSFYRNDFIELSYENEINLFRFVAVNNDVTKQIEVKYIDKLTDERITKSIGSKIKDIKKFNVDVLGTMYEIKKETLKLEW